jgi:hypothetical protein
MNDTDAAPAAAGAIAVALASGHLDLSVVIGTALGVLLVALVRPAVGRALRRATTPDAE